MTSARRPAHGVRRWLALLTALLVAGSSLAVGLGGSTASAAPLQTELRLSTLAPVSIQPGGTLRTSGTFTTTRTLDAVQVRLEVGTTAFLTRTGLAEAAATPPVTTPLFGAVDELGKVQAGTVARFRIQVPTDDLPFFATGVYPVRLVAVDQATGLPLSETSSFLPYAPEGVGVSPSRLLMFWPIVGTPASAPGGEMLGGELSAGGRLSVLTRGGARAPATWLVDPAVLDQADDLDTSDAQGWLESYRNGSAGREVVLLPFGDPDSAAVGAAGRPRMFATAWNKGARVYRQLIGDVPPSDLVWPVDGAGDAQTIDVSEEAGASVVLLSEDNVPLLTPLPYTPSGRFPWPDSELEVMLADPATSALVATPASTTTDVLLARQRFLAETLLHALELPSAPRLLVVAPPRRWDPSPLWADSLVGAVRKAGWLDPVTVDEAMRPSAPTVERAAPVIPEAVAERQLPSSMVDAALAGLLANRRLAGILTHPEQLSGPIEDELLTSVSTAWRADPEGAVAAQQATLDRLAIQRGRVRIVSGGGTLADDRGSYPLTLRNQLDQEVVVRLAVSSTDPLRLRVSGPTGPIRIGPDESVSVSVELDAVTSGRLAFDAQLLTRADKPYNEPVQVTVDVRGFGRITLLVFGAAAALLVLAAAIRVTRRIRGARRGTS